MEREKGLRERELGISVSMDSNITTLEPWIVLLFIAGPTHLIGWFNLVCHELFMQKVHAPV